jgi:protein SCO1/2
MISRYAFLIFLVGFFACDTSSPEETGLPYYLEPTFTPEWLSDSEKVDLHTIAPFELINQSGDTVTREDLLGDIYVANFFFTVCPGVCPKMTSNLHRIQEKFAGDSTVKIVSHTVMPWVDSVAVLKEYADRKEINPGQWHLLTGSKEAIYQLGRESYFADEGFGKTVTGASDFLHTENIVLIDEAMHIRGIYNGTLPLEMARLEEDIRVLQKE